MRLAPAPIAAAVLAVAVFGLSAPAAAQDSPVDIGVIKRSDKSVVQKLLYTREGRTEFGAHLGWIPFDSYTTTPIGGVHGGMHFSEEWGAEVAIQGGYSLKNFTYRQLESDAYGIQPDAYKHLLGVVADAQWSPIYGKFSWRGKKVVHHDVYGLAGAAVAIEQAMMPDATTTTSPGFALGMGMRVYLDKDSFIRIQIRDDVLIQKRVKTADTQGTFLKQSVALTVGYSRLTKGK
jgi:outer membrane beta-barrel protein